MGIYMKLSQINDVCVDFFESDEFDFYFEKITQHVDVNGYVWDEHAKYGINSPVTYKQLLKVIDAITHCINPSKDDDDCIEWRYNGYKIEMVCGQGCTCTITKLKG